MVRTRPYDCSVWQSRLTIHYASASRFKRPVATTIDIELLLTRCRLNRKRNSRHRRGMLKLLLSTAIGSAETQCGCEDGPPPLSCLDGPRDKTPSVADSLNVIENRYFRIACEDEITVHAVYSEIGGDGSHCGRQGLGDCGSAVDTSGSRRMP